MAKTIIAKRKTNKPTKAAKQENAVRGFFQPRDVPWEGRNRPTHTRPFDLLGL